MKNIFFFGISILFLFSCKQESETEIRVEVQQIKNEYAKLFSIYKYESYNKLITRNKEGSTENVYYLFDKNDTIPDTLKNMQIVRTPVNKAITLSTTHLSFFDALDKIECIKAVSDYRYIYNKEVHKKIDEGKIEAVGYENALDFELLISLSPDLVCVYDINGTISPIINRLKKFQIPVIQINEYLESSPLAQSEWIKVFGLLVNEERKAAEYFKQISESYEKLKQLTDSIHEKPNVLLNMPWKGTWYIPGGNSNIAQMIHDAGGDYIWAETDEIHTIPMSIEDVYLKTTYADLWLNPGQANSISDIIFTDNRLMDFAPVKTGSVYNRNKRISEKGANDYMESGTIRPDLILKDLVYILHPQLLPDHEFFYYKKLE
jgi:iron complex transport system substrate-binding protein